MKIPRKVGLFIVLLALAGLALFITLLVRHGAADITQAVAQTGWLLALVVAAHFVTLFFDSLSWRALIPREHRPGFGKLLLVHWIGDSISSMLPVAQVGGEVVRVRLITVQTPEDERANRQPVPLPIAASSVLVGMTISLATQIVLTLSGLVVLILVTGHDGLTRPILLAAGMGVLCVLGFYAVQRVGIFRIISRIVSHVAGGGAWEGLARRGEQLDQDIRACYARRGGIAISSFWTMCTWIAGAFEVYVAMWALGLEGGFAYAYVLGSLNEAVRSAMFFVPGALGVQEGGFLLVGRLLGISAKGSLALSLMRRVRELAWGIPGLLAWQWIEGRRLWVRRPLAAQAATKAP